MRALRFGTVKGYAAAEVYSEKGQQDHALVPTKLKELERFGHGTPQVQARNSGYSDPLTAVFWVAGCSKPGTLSLRLCNIQDSLVVGDKELTHGDDHAVADHELIPDRVVIDTLPTITFRNQAWMGMVLGYAAGFSLRRIGKFVLGIVGTEIILLQYMSYRGWVRVDWNAVTFDLMPVVDYSSFKRVVKVLKHRLPFAASFSAGVFTGLKYDLL